MNYGSVISKHRSAVMGIAALLILCFHAKAETGIALWDILINKHGNIGVDIFVFLTGYGTAFSLAHDSDFYSFYLRRVRRVLPSYYVAIFIMCFFVKVDRSTLFTAIIPIGVWMGHGNCWYISATMVYYLLVPLFYFLLRQAKFSRVTLGILLIVTGLMIPSAVVNHSVDIALMRIPALVMGVALGVFQQMHIEKRERLFDFIVIIMVFAIGTLIFCNRGVLTGIITSKQENRLWKNLVTPTVVIIIVCILEGMNHTFLRFINKALEEVGKYSLEIYLAHLVIMAISSKTLHLTGNPLAMLLLIFSYPMARLLYYCGQKLLLFAKKLQLFRNPETSK